MMNKTPSDDITIQVQMSTDNFIKQMQEMWIIQW
jgi:hypothetical protein